VSTAKSLFIRRESGVWGSLWSQRVVLAEANECLAQRSTKVANLRLLRDELKAEAEAARAKAALARTEAQQWQLELGQVIGERDQSRSQATEAMGRTEALGCQLAEVSARAGALVEDLVVAVGSAQSAQAVASEQHARAEGTFRPLYDFDSASFFNSCLKNFVRLSAEFETALNESVKALAQAAEQKEADRVAMFKAISAFC
jgi:chromosome segregation ATPase